MRIKWRRRAQVAVHLWMLARLAGCGAATPEGPQPFPVHGQVTYQGQPAVGFRVSFYPLFEQRGPKFAPSALTDSSGRFELQSYQPGDGASPGKYAVTFTWPQGVSSGDPDDAPQIVDRLRGRLGDPDKSPYQVTVKEGENVLEPFVLK